MLLSWQQNLKRFPAREVTLNIYINRPFSLCLIVIIHLVCASILWEEKKTDVDKLLGQAGISVLRVTMSHQRDLTHSQTSRYIYLQHPNTSDEVSYVLICFGVIFLDKFYLYLSIWGQHDEHRLLGKYLNKNLWSCLGVSDISSWPQSRPSLWSDTVTDEGTVTRVEFENSIPQNLYYHLIQILSKNHT